MKLQEVIEYFAAENNSSTDIILEVIRKGSEEVDEDLCFQGTPSDFLQNYVKENGYIKGMDLLHVCEFRIDNDKTTDILIRIIK